MQKEENKNFETELDSNQLQNLTQNISEGEKTIDKNLEVKEDKEAEQNQNRHFPRRQRRPIQNMMERQQKKMYKSTNINLKAFAKKIRQNQKNGKTLHDRYMQNMMKKEEQFFIEKEENITQSLKDRGFTKKQIEAYIEDWYNDVKIWSEGAV